MADAIGNGYSMKEHIVSTSTDGTARYLGVNWSENFDHEEVLALYYKANGKKAVHLCPEWDYMAIHEGSPEFEACLGDKEKLR